MHYSLIIVVVFVLIIIRLHYLLFFLEFIAHRTMQIMLRVEKKKFKFTKSKDFNKLFNKLFFIFRSHVCGILLL